MAERSKGKQKANQEEGPRYEPHPKHKVGFTVAGPPRTVPGASKCPPEIGATDATAMPREAFRAGFVDGESDARWPKCVYWYSDGRFYRALRTNRVTGVYHGFPEVPQAIPTWVKRKMRDRGILAPGEYRRFRSSIR
ncbi:MAG: hypothetical protein ACOC8B_00565 [Gemmatimonadota bacterium]